MLFWASIEACNFYFFFIVSGVLGLMGARTQGVRTGSSAALMCRSCKACVCVCVCVPVSGVSYGGLAFRGSLVVVCVPAKFDTAHGKLEVPISLPSRDLPTIRVSTDTLCFIRSWPRSTIETVNGSPQRPVLVFTAAPGGALDRKNRVIHFFFFFFFFFKKKKKFKLGNVTSCFEIYTRYMYTEWHQGFSSQFHARNALPLDSSPAD